MTSGSRHAPPPALNLEEQLATQSIVIKQPLSFEPNRGQSDGQVLFLSRNPGYDLYLTAQKTVIGLDGVEKPLTFTWRGANPDPQIAGLSVLPGRHNYLRGNDPEHWQRNIPTYEKVRYRDLYPGIDLIYYGRQRHLEYDLVVAPGADPTAIRLQPLGMDSLHLDDEGTLRIELAGRVLSLRKPVIYQELAGVKHAVSGNYVLLADNQVAFQLGGYDRGKPLIIDPVLNYSTYLGGSDLDLGKGVAVDGAGNVYMVGQTASGDFPATGAYQNSNAGGDSDAYVAKFDSNGALLFATYLGGSGADRGFGVAADSSAVYVVGDTTSTDFPLQSAAQSSSGGDTDAFVAKLSADGSSLMYSTYLGGSHGEEGLGIAVDGSGNAYVTGATLSDNFSTTTVSPSFNIGISQVCDDPSKPGTAIPCSDAYVVKYDAGGSLLYATYLGGSLEDVATSITVNNGQEAFVTGVTYSPTFNTKDGFQQTSAGGVGDAFVVKLAANGSVAYGTYLGGDGWDQGQAIALDNAGNIYVVGATNSSAASLSLTNPLQAIYGGGGYDAFAAKLTPGSSTGYDIQYLTYLGGTDRDLAFGVATDNVGDAYVVGETMSQDFRISSAIQSTWIGGSNNRWGDAFVTKINPSGTLAWSTYLGGTDDDWAYSVALDSSQGIYVSGSSFSSDFPVTNPYQATSSGSGDAMLFKLTDSSVTVDLQLSVSATPDPVGSGETLTYQVTVENLSTSTNASNVVVVATLPNGISYTSATPGGTCSANGGLVTCNIGSIAAGGTAMTNINTVSNTAGDITFTAKLVRANQPDSDSSNNSASVTTKAAVGSTGGGVWSLVEWALCLIGFYLKGKRRIVSWVVRPTPVANKVFNTR